MLVLLENLLQHFLVSSKKGDLNLESAAIVPSCESKFTFAPSSRNLRPVAFPIPLVAPVTRTFLPEKVLGMRTLVDIGTTRYELHRRITAERRRRRRRRRRGRRRGGEEGEE